MKLKKKEKMEKSLVGKKIVKVVDHDTSFEIKLNNGDRLVFEYRNVYKLYPTITIRLNKKFLWSA